MLDTWEWNLTTLEDTSQLLTPTDIMAVVSPLLLITVPHGLFLGLLLSCNDVASDSTGKKLNATAACNRAGVHVPLPILPQTVVPLGSLQNCTLQE